MNKFLRVVMLILALAGFLVFLSFNIQNIGPAQSVTVGMNLSPWLQWSKVKGMEKFTEKFRFNLWSWSMAGGVAGGALLLVRSRIKG